MLHPHDDTCLGCRAARRLQLTDGYQVQALHSMAMYLLHRRDLIQTARERDFDVGAAHVTSAIEDEMAEMFAVRPPSTTTVN